MVVNHKILFSKTQSKMTDCWYACIQMVKSAVVGAKTKPGGATVVAQRRKLNAGLSFAGPAGASVIEENELVDISSKVKLDVTGAAREKLVIYRHSSVEDAGRREHAC